MGGEFLKNIPSVSGGDYGGNVNNGNSGYSTASLRGLRPNRTLTLLNGKRPTPAGTNGFVDLNMLPIHAVERIEILRDGASSIYGSDAIAGVINVITKTHYEGADAKVQFDATDKGDGHRSFYGLSIGNSNDKGNILLVRNT